MIVHKITSQNVATSFDQLHGHSQAARAHETKITVANVM